MRYQFTAMAAVAMMCLTAASHLGAQAPAAPVAAPAAPAAPAPAPQAAPAPAPPPRPVASMATPLQVQLVISRYQGEKKISSVPYTMSVTSDRPAGPNARMRMGVQIAVPQTVFTPASGADTKINPIQSFSYKDIGTSIDVRATPVDDGRFQLAISVEDSSVYSDPSDGPAPRVANVPVVRSFSTSSALLLRDGQTGQFTAATDKINGEVMRIEVTLRVVK